MSTITIDQRFCGPPDSGNGGYVAGRLAEYIEGTARVRLLKPPPLEMPMEVIRTDKGVDLLFQGEACAKAWPCDLDATAPYSPGLAEAIAMSKSFGGFQAHAFPGCFGCGPDRHEGDGLRIFAGSSKDSHFVAATWSPDRSLSTEDGLIKPRYIWSALDCPGAWSFLDSAGSPVLLGEFSVRIDGPVYAGTEYIITGWEIKREGRKHLTGTAISTAQGKHLAVSRATWFDIDPAYLG